MNNKELLESLRHEFEQLGAAGHATLNTEALTKYLAQLEDLASRDPQGLDAIAVEKFKAGHEVAVTRLKQAGDSDLEMFRTVIATGEAAIKAGMTINGGGAVALLAFVGHLVSSAQTQGLIARFASPLALFVAGVLAGAAAYGVRYPTQWFYARHFLPLGHSFNLVSILLTLSSYVAFAVAALSLYSIFRAF